MPSMSALGMLATGDQTVLPAIETLGLGAARGQSGVGSDGHRFASRTADGGFNGPLLGYGAINNASLSMLSGLVLASKCGIEHPDLDPIPLTGATVGALAGNEVTTDIFPRFPVCR